MQAASLRVSAQLYTAPVQAVSEQLFLANLALIDQVVAQACRRHGFDRDEAEEMTALVRLRIIENDYAILRSFSGRSSLRTFLGVVVHRVLIDEKVRRWGKWRPSAVATRMGPVAQRLEELVYRRGHSFTEAFELLANHEVDLSRQKLEAIAGRLPPRTTRHRFESDEALQELAITCANPEQVALEQERARLQEEAEQALREAVAALPAEDRLIIELRYRQGVQVSRIARMLQLPQRPLYRRIEQLLRRLRQQLEAAGVTGELIEVVLHTPGPEPGVSEDRS